MNSIPEPLQTNGAVPDEASLRLVFQVPDIRCAACALKIEQALVKLPGVNACWTNLPSKRVMLDGIGINADDVEQKLKGLGFTPRTANARASSDSLVQEKRDLLARLGVAGIGMMQVMMFALAEYVAGADGIEPAYSSLMQWAAFAVATPITFYSAQPFHSNAWRDLRNLSLGMDVPVSLAILSAYLLSTITLLTHGTSVYFDSVCMFAFLLLSGRYLELGARHQYLDSIELADSCLPVRASAVHDLAAIDSTSSDVQVLLKELTGGEYLRVPAGSIMPADGRVIAGSGSVSEAAFTGESLPVDKQPGARVLAGSENLSAQLIIEVAVPYEEFVIRKMSQLYEDASRYKPAFAILADRLARYFVAGILSLALATGVFWFLAGETAWFRIALTVLVVSCPCALSLATPVAYTVALTALRRKGVVVSAGRFLEKLGQIDTLLFDKTGTLTTGALSIDQVALLDAEMDKEQVLQLCSALEAPSAHPVARAFSAEHALSVLNAATVPGAGVTGTINSVEYKLGKPAFAWHEPIVMPEGQGIWVLLTSSKPLAWVCLRDSIRPEAKTVITRLKQRFALSLMSGDRREEVERIGAALGIESVFSQMNPEEKFVKVRDLQDHGAHVLMIGDGINDAIAMGAAHASIAVSPVDIVVQEAAEATLLQGDLTVLTQLLDYAQKVRRIITQNIVWALAYNLCVIPLAALGWLEPWQAALGMSTSSLLVLLNAGRLKQLV